MTEGDLRGWRTRGPLADSYPSALVLVLLALVPYLALTTANVPLAPIVAKSVGLSRQSFQLTSGMANAAYAFGTVLAVQLAVHLPGRRLLVLYATLFVIASVLAAAAPTAGLFIAGRIAQGLCTSLMLIAAVPPLVIGWSAQKMRWTAMTMNMGVFGAVALGPVLGGAQAGSRSWRLLFWIVAGLGALAVLFAILTFEDQGPQDRSAPWDWVAQTLAGAGCAVAFFGASELDTHRLLSLIVFLPLLAGLAMIVALVGYEYAIERPLMPVRSLTSTLPLAGIVVAMCAGAASVAIVELVQTTLATRTSPTHAGMLFWPEFGGALAMAVALGALVRSRLLPLLPVAGMVLLAGGAAVLTGVTRGPDALVLVGSGLVGLGVGGSVSPALFVAGFSQKAAQIQRVFALIELLRGVAAFIVAPVLVHFAVNDAGGPASGVHAAIWICFGLALAGGALAVGLFLRGRARLRPPRLEAWLDGEEPALDSPTLA